MKYFENITDEDSILLISILQTIAFDFSLSKIKELNIIKRHSRNLVLKYLSGELIGQDIVRKPY